jgi:hypothetical protein
MRIASSSLSWPELFAVDFHFLDGHVLAYWALLTVHSTSLEGRLTRQTPSVTTVDCLEDDQAPLARIINGLQ